MKSTLILGAIFFLSVLTPHPQTMRGEAAGAEAELEIRTGVPEMGHEADEEVTGARMRDLDAIDGYLWSASDRGWTADGRPLGGDVLASLPAWNGGTEWEAD